MRQSAYAFGPFVLDAADRRLLRNGAPVEVSARYFDALALLAAENGRLVTKERFHDEVWRGIPVTDEALTQCIRSLRRALEDDAAAPTYIETVPRHGYRFIAAVESAVAARDLDGPRETAFPALVSDVVAAALGGGLAGVAGGLLYLSAGLVNPAMGTASALLVLVSINLVLGVLAGAAVGLGIAIPHYFGKSGWQVVVGGALGGLVVGAVAHMIGNDLFQLLFGQTPGRITGALEGMILGGALGAAAAFNDRAPASALWRRLLPGFAAGALGGLAISLLGGRLMAGSLAELAGRFPASQLGVPQAADLGPAALVLATALEGALFVGCASLAVSVSRRLRAAT